MTNKAKDEEVTKVDQKTTPAVKRTAEEIAIARGWLPEDGSAPRSNRDWPNWWRYAAAFGHKPRGQEVTEAEFDKAVETAINANHG